MFALPLQAVDSFLLGYNVGDALLVVLLLGILATLLVQRSMKMLSLHLITIGVLFVILPAGMLEPSTGSFLPSMPAYKALGLVLIVISPLIFTVARK